MCVVIVGVWKVRTYARKSPARKSLVGWCGLRKASCAARPRLPVVGWCGLREVSCAARPGSAATQDPLFPGLQHLASGSGVRLGRAAAAGTAVLAEECWGGVVRASSVTSDSRPRCCRCFLYWICSDSWQGKTVITLRFPNLDCNFQSASKFIIRIQKSHGPLIAKVLYHQRQTVKANQKLPRISSWLRSSHHAPSHNAPLPLHSPPPPLPRRLFAKPLSFYYKISVATL